MSTPFCPGKVSSNFRSAMRACTSPASRVWGVISKYFSSNQTASAGRPLLSAQFATLKVADGLVAKGPLSSPSALHKLDLCPALNSPCTLAPGFGLRSAWLDGGNDGVSASENDFSSPASSSSDASKPM